MQSIILKPDLQKGSSPEREVDIPSARLHGHQRRGQHLCAGGSASPPSVMSRSVRMGNTPAAAVAAGVDFSPKRPSETAPVRYELKMLRRMMPVAP